MSICAHTGQPTVPWSTLTTAGHLPCLWQRESLQRFSFSGETSKVFQSKGGQLVKDENTKSSLDLPTNSIASGGRSVGAGVHVDHGVPWVA